MISQMKHLIRLVWHVWCGGKQADLEPLAYSGSYEECITSYKGRRNLRKVAWPGPPS